MPTSMLEALPDEILMIIIRNTGDIFTIFQAFFGLNQRINNILVDKRTHLLTDFLLLSNHDENIDDYYNSYLFHISEQLLSLKPTEITPQLRQCLESLVAFHIRHKYNHSIKELELGLAHVQSIRMNLTDDELQKIDMELKEVFDDLQNSSKPMKNIKQIQSLVLTKGARLECSDTEYNNFNFADAAIRFLIDIDSNENQSTSQYFINSLVKMFKTLIISNLSLLHNRAYATNGGCVVYFFLFHVVYKCRSFNSYKAPQIANIPYYQAVVDLLLFVLQCLYYEQVPESWWIWHFYELLDFICPVKLRIDQELFVYTSQNEILKILFDENILSPTISEFDPLQFYSQSLGNLFICNRFDLISTIFHHNEHVRNKFQNCWDDAKFVGILTGDSTRRRVFQSVLEDPIKGTWLATTTNLLFILLHKRECRYVKKLFKLSPSLIHRLDTDGNDPLLHVCLKGRGCRQRLIEYLLKIGCDTQRRNLNGENFIEALQLGRNRKLLEKLIEQETIQIDQDSGEIKVNSS